MTSSARVIQFPFHRRIDFDPPETEAEPVYLDLSVLRGPPEFDSDVEAGAFDVAAQIAVEGIPI